MSGFEIVDGEGGGKFGVRFAVTAAEAFKRNPV